MLAVCALTLEGVVLLLETLKLTIGVDNISTGERAQNTLQEVAFRAELHEVGIHALGSDGRERLSRLLIVRRV